jgi:hypothetical protein
MLNANQNPPTPVEQFFLSAKDTCKTLGAGETTLWSNYVKRGFLNPRHSGRKVLFTYEEVKALAKRIEAGELASARSAFSDHAAAIKKSIESRRRKAQARTNATPAAVPKHRTAPASEPPDPPPEWPGRRP